MSAPLGDETSFADRGPRAVSPAGMDCAEANGAVVINNPTAMLMPRTDLVPTKSLSCLRPQQLRNSAVASAELGTDPIAEICRYNPEIINHPELSGSSVARSVEGYWLAVVTGSSCESRP